MRTTRQSLRATLLLAIIICSSLGCARGQESSPLRELAREIVTHAQTRSALSLIVRNLTNTPSGDFAAAQRELESELSALHVRLVKQDQAATTVRVSLADTPGGALWVAEVEQGGSREVAMVAARSKSSTRPTTGGVFVRRTLLWKQPAPMLDFASFSSGGVRQLLILEPGRIVQRGLPDSPSMEFAIPHSRPWPRDVRGRLLLTPDRGFEAQLPGVKCTGNWQALAATSCVESDDPWTLGSIRAFYNTSRNYFTGMLLPPAPGGNALPAFYTVAEITLGGTKTYVFDGVDGHTRLIGGNGENLDSVGGWGSDIASVTAECGTGKYILTTRVSESDRLDGIQAFELVNREPVEASAPMEVPGPVVALWSLAETSAATAIVQNIKSSEYEAYSLSVDCSR